MAAESRARGVYVHACPNCGGPVGDDRLLDGLPCPRCLGERIAAESPVDVARVLEERGSLREGSSLDFYSWVEEEAGLVEGVFSKAVGSRLWSAQRAWVRRVLKGRSFAVIAPTGVGKTTFGVLMAVYLAGLGGRSYIVVPTTPLVKMVEERALKIADAAGIPAKVLAIHSRMSQRQRREALEALKSGDFHILVTTSQYMIRNAEALASYAEAWPRWEPPPGLDGRRRRWWSRWAGDRRGFWFVFVDDVDAVLKSGKSVDALLRVVGFTRGDVERGWELLALQRRLVAETRRAQQELEKRLRELRARLRRTGKRITSDDVRRIREEVFRERLAPIYERLEKISRDIAEAQRRAAVLVVSSATGRPRGSRVRLFQALLGFQAGAAGEAIRNVVDSYTFPGPRGLEERVVEIVERLGGGGLVYVPVDKGSEYAEKLAELLRSRGVAAEAFTSRNPGALERFRSGETQVLVGVAVYYGVAVRGLDLPERIRYAVFAGVPRHRFSARFDDPHPMSVLRGLAVLAEHAPRDVAEEAQRRLARLRQLTRRMSTAALQRLAEELREGRLETPAAREFASALEWLRGVLARSDVWEALEKADDVAVARIGGDMYIMVPDVATYIQASGRTSRMYPGGITKGLSVVVADDERLLNGLMKRTRWLYEAEWRRFEELDLPRLLAEIDRDRERVRAILEGRLKPEYMELLKTALLVVESPNKARTIAGFFGRPSARQMGPLRVYEVSTGDYVLLVAASGGHVYDLVKPPRPQVEADPRWLLDVLSGSVEGYDWSTAVNVHGVLAARRGKPRYLPAYSPLARCLVCGHQWAVSPEEFNPVEGRRELRCPVCGSPLVKNSWDIIEALRDIASEVDVVMIGTDPDTEGEKIGYDLASLIRPSSRSIVRVEFHEITRKAIMKAIHEPREFNTHLVEAQLVRRVEDRWIGFTLSPLLWLKFWPWFCRWSLSVARRSSMKLKSARAMLNAIERLGNMGRECERPNYNLSAGRVQTPTLGWIVYHTLGSRYLRFPVYSVVFEGPARLELEIRGDEVSEELRRSLEEAKKLVDEAFHGRLGSSILEALDLLEEKRREKARLIKRINRELREQGAIRARVESVEESVEELRPLPPFTTDVLLAEAAARLGLSAPEAMRLAQDLFELGLITYHRTDSTRVSDAGIAVAREYIRQRFGEDRLEELFRPRRWGEGGAHEAIRPTRPIDAGTLRRLVDEGVLQLARPLTQRHLRLYDLIFRRFIASQMREAVVRRQRARITVEVTLAGSSVALQREVERVVEVLEEGWLMVYPVARVEERLVPGVYEAVSVRVRVGSLVRLLTQADVVRLMKERGIGRPSTYAKIIETLLKRGYVVSSGRAGALIATKKGIGVYDFLARRFPRLVSEEATRRLQEVMDRIEEGMVYYEEVLDSILRELAQALRSPESGLTEEEARRLLPLLSQP